jgi:hypothetical protein
MEASADAWLCSLDFPNTLPKTPDMASLRPAGSRCDRLESVRENKKTAAGSKSSGGIDRANRVGGGTGTSEVGRSPLARGRRLATSASSAGLVVGSRSGESGRGRRRGKAGRGVVVTGHGSKERGIGIGAGLRVWAGRAGSRSRTRAGEECRARSILGVADPSRN